MADVFISYARRDREFVVGLRDCVAQNGVEAWVDLEGIPPSAKWMDEITRAIEACGSVLFVVSASWAESEICRQELAHAVQYNKRLIPVLREDVDSAGIPAPLAALNWILYRPADDASVAIQRLLIAIRTDLDWLREHTRLLVRAVEWESAQRDDSFSLRGAELYQAERWFGQSAGREPPPSLLQSQFVVASRAASSRRQRRLLAGVTVALVATVFLAAVAWYQRNQKEEQRTIAVSRQLAAEAQSHLATELDLGLLLGAAAVTIKPTLEARSSLLSALLRSPRLLHHLHVGQQAAAVSVAFSADNTVLTTGGMDGNVRLWDVKSGQPLDNAILAHGAAVASVAFSPDGKQIASGGNDGFIRIWDRATGRLVHEPMRSDTIRVNAVAFSPDGQVLMAGGESGSLCVWRLADGLLLGRWLDGQLGQAYSLSIHPHEQLVAAGLGLGVGLWGRAALGARVMVGELLPGSEGWLAATVAFSSDGTMLAAGSTMGDTRLWRINNGVFTKLTELHTGPVYSVAFSPNGRFLVTGGHDMTVGLWDVNGGRSSVERLTGNVGGVTAVAVDSRGERIASAGPDGIIRLWSFDARPSIGQRLNWGTKAVADVSAIAANAGVLVSGHADGAVRTWKMATRQPLVEMLTGHVGKVTSVAVSRDGRIVASGAADGTIRFWDAARMESRGATAKNRDREIDVIEFSPDGNTLVSSDGKNLRLWDVATVAPIGNALRSGDDFITSVAFTPDGRLLVSGDMDGIVRIWNMATGQPLVSTGMDPNPRVVRSIAISPDGGTMAVAGQERPNDAEHEDGSIHIWNVGTRQHIGAPILGHRGTIYSVTFSPDGSTLVSGAGFGEIRLWDVISRRPIGAPIKANNSYVSAIAFDASGRNFASIGDDGELMLWDIDLESWKQRACIIANRNPTCAEWRQYLNDEPYAKMCPTLPGPDTCP